MAGTFRRRKLLVEPHFQCTLAVRVVSYWCFWMLSLGLLLFCWRVATGPRMPAAAHIRMLFLQLGPPALASFVLVPILVVDTLRLSNRLVGPLVRLKDGMRRLTRGEPVKPIHFRTGDFMDELATEFNKLAEFAQRKELGVFTEPEQQQQPEAAAV
jgi:hypothetical protein